MQVYEIYDCSKLANSMISHAKNGKLVYAVLFYEESAELIKELLGQNKISVMSLNIDNPEFNGYFDEYYVALDDDMRLWVEPAFVKGNYLGFLSDILYIDGDANSRIIIDNPINTCIELVKADNEILDFIHKRFPGNSGWLNGNCYYFSLILKNRFPEGTIHYDVIDGHFVFKYKDLYYDYSGVTMRENGYMIEWDKFDEYDSIQKKRIVRDCIQ